MLRLFYKSPLSLVYKQALRGGLTVRAKSAASNAIKLMPCNSVFSGDFNNLVELLSEQSPLVNAKAMITLDYFAVSIMLMISNFIESFVHSQIKNIKLMPKFLE